VFWWQLSLTTSDRMCQVWVWPTSGRVPDVWCCPLPPRWSVDRWRRGQRGRGLRRSVVARTAGV